MVIVPVDAEGREAEYVDQQPWNQRLERGEGVAVWGPECERHDGNDHGEYCVAKAFQARGTYLVWGLR
jgi:hypothetical protein